MGIYLNPGNANFQMSLNSEVYVDKSPLIAELNARINTRQRYICISRPRRFGKSLTAEMLSAYYSKGCDSSAQFSSLKIARDSSFAQHLNRHNVIFLNIQLFWSRARGSIEQCIHDINSFVRSELVNAFPKVNLSGAANLFDALNMVHGDCAESFIFVFDEWDCVMRDRTHSADAVEAWLDYLRALLKDQPYVALAYMTGILPIKKYGTHSALNMFGEYSMTEPGVFAPYIGFTEDEVFALCQKFHRDFDQMRLWYDGYSFRKADHIYNPNSVVRAICEDLFSSYWTQTETYEALQRYIDLNLEGLRDDVVRLIAGDSVAVNTASFKNDMTSCRSRDEVLTLLVHLGYLSEDREATEKAATDDEIAVTIPNEEIRKEFRNVVRQSRCYPGVHALIAKTNELLENIWSLNADAVARAFDAAHQDHTSILKYNDENSLSCVVALSLLLSTADTYDVHRELPAGKGFADMVYLPKRGVDKPALLIELKKEASADSAIAQIKTKNYTNFFRDYEGEVLLVGINYSPDSKRHDCLIERWCRASQKN